MEIPERPSNSGVQTVEVHLDYYVRQYYETFLLKELRQIIYTQFEHNSEEVRKYGL